MLVAVCDLHVVCSVGESEVPLMGIALRGLAPLGKYELEGIGAPCDLNPLIHCCQVGIFIVQLRGERENLLARHLWCSGGLQTVARHVIRASANVALVVPLIAPSLRHCTIRGTDPSAGFRVL